jgi:hypothetical protein
LKILGKGWQRAKNRYGIVTENNLTGIDEIVKILHWCMEFSAGTVLILQSLFV